MGELELRCARRRLSAALVLAASVALLAAGSGTGSSGTAIVLCGQAVTTNAYLTQDLVCTGDGVRGRRLGDHDRPEGIHPARGPRTSDYGIDDTAGYDRVTIKNGVLRNFGFGIRAGEQHET